MAKYLKGLSLQYYRGIGATQQFMAPFQDFNFFIGANNAGKSTVLNFISKFLPENIPPSPATIPKNTLDPLDKYLGGTAGRVLAGIAIPLSDFVNSISNSIPNQDHRALLSDSIKAVCNALSRGHFIWFLGEVPFTSKFSINTPDISTIRKSIDDRAWQQLWSLLTRQGHGSIEQHWIPETIQFFQNAQKTTMPKAELIPAIRQIGPKSESFSDYSGKGLIDRLAELQSPDHDKRSDRSLFDRINAFLQTITGLPTARIEIPHNREHILVHMGGKVLPLSSLGTGIHEVVMIAAFCTISIRRIVCIEEPELHLHPLLQRKLISYLRENTTNQYFIATHSASFIDTPNSAIFHVTDDGKQTLIRESLLRSERFAICVDLGHKASDIVQSNAIVWVEGPSDRLYIKHWIRHVAPDLIEGIHYSIMFYGGRLLSHLSAHDEEINEFIALRSLNRNLAIVIDSDKASSRSKINETKTRIVTELSSSSGIVWVSKGREIENYIPASLLHESINSAYKNSYFSPAKKNLGIYDHVLYFRRAAKTKNKTLVRRAGGVVKSVDKVKVAREVCLREADLSMLDLKKRVNEIVTMIKRANA